MNIINIHTPVTYARCLRALEGGRDPNCRLLDRRTKLRLYRDANRCRIRLYYTDIVTVHEDDTLALTLGGWGTQLTFSTLYELATVRISSCASAPFDNRIRLWGCGGDPRWGLPFTNGMQFRHGALLHPEDAIDEQTRPTPEAIKTWTRAVKWLKAQARPRIAIGEFDALPEDWSGFANVRPDHVLRACDLDSAALQQLLSRLMLCGFEANLALLRSQYLARAEKYTTRTSYYPRSTS